MVFLTSRWLEREIRAHAKSSRLLQWPNSESFSLSNNLLIRVLISHSYLINRYASNNSIQSGEDAFLSLLEQGSDTLDLLGIFLNFVEIALATRNDNTIQIYTNCTSSKFENWKLIHTLTGVLDFAMYLCSMTCRLLPWTGIRIIIAFCLALKTVTRMCGTWRTGSGCQLWYC